MTQKLPAFSFKQLVPTAHLASTPAPSLEATFNSINFTLVDDVFVDIDVPTLRQLTTMRLTVFYNRRKMLEHSQRLVVMGALPADSAAPTSRVRHRLEGSVTWE